MDRIYEVVKTSNGYDSVIVNKEDIPKKEKVHKAVSTPGHGYLKVPLSRLRKYNLTREISSCSYIGRNEASLEEDADAQTYIDALLSAGDRYFYTSSYVSKANTGMRAYHPYFAENSFNEGDVVRMDSSLVKLGRSYRGKTRLFYQPHGMEAYCSTRSLFSHITPESTKTVIVVHPTLGALISFDNDDNPQFTQQDDNAKPPYVMAFSSIDKAKSRLNKSLKLAVTAQVCHFKIVEHDAWQDGQNAPIDAAVRVGCKAWPIQDQYNEKVHKPVSTRVQGNTRVTCYNKEHPGVRVEHEVLLPSSLIKLPTSLEPALQDAHIDFQCIGGELYVDPNDKFTYISLLQDMGYSYFERTRWHTDPLWADAYLFPKAA